MSQRDDIKLFFQTGDRPTQAQFYQWLDGTIFQDEVYDFINPKVLSAQPLAFPYNTIFGQYSAPVNDSNIDVDLSLPKNIGCSCIVLHKTGSEPTYGSAIVKTSLSQSYDPTKVNILTFQWLGGNKVFLTITQEV